MRLSTKIFVAISASSAAAILTVSFLAYESAARLHAEQYREQNQLRIELVARHFAKLEQAYDRVALDAARAVRERIGALRHPLTRDELARAARDLGVANIALIDSRGDFIASADGRTGVNVFKFCPSYRDLLGRSEDMQQTPLLPQDGGKEVYKYTMVPGAGRAAMIDVSVAFDEVGSMLQELVDDRSDVLRVVLRSPSGQVLGDLSEKGLSPGELAAAGEPIRVELEADRKDCCECATRGFVPAGAPYHYEFLAYVSNRSLRSAIRRLETEFAGIFVLMLALALAVAGWLGRRIARKTERIRDAVDEIARSKDFSRAIPVGAAAGRGDEIDTLARHFNEMLTAMARAQDELISAKKAEARASIAAQVAHDIRSPLSSMNLALSRLQQAVQAAGIQASVAEMISVLAHGVSRVSGIVKRLSGTGPQAGAAAQAPEAPKLTLIDKLLLDVAQEHALRVAPGKRFEIRGFAPVPCVWGVVQATEIQAALSNLLNNAFEAVGAGGSVTLFAETGERSFGVSVRDDGVGIAPENLERVFEREFTSGKAGGSGLGLFQAKKAIEANEGSVRLESRPGAGTTVSFTLPVEQRPAWIADRVAVPSGATLVLVDDDPAVLEAWREKARGVAPVREFQSISALETALASLGPIGDLVFVLDQYASDGRDGMTGLAFIEKHGAGARAYLCTSEYDDPAIQARVRAAKARLVPKPCLAGARVVIPPSGPGSEESRS